MTDNVLVAGGNVILGELINLAETAGMQKLTDEQKKKAFQIAVSLYLDKAVQSGQMSSEQLQQMGQQAQETPEGQQIMNQMRAE